MSHACLRAAWVPSSDDSNLVILGSFAVQEEYKRLEADPGYTDGVLDAGANRAESIAAATLDGVKARIGFR